VGHWEKSKDGIISDAIEGESSHIEANPIFSSFMPTIDISFKPISKLIFDLNDSSYALSPETVVILEIHHDTQSKGVMKAIRKTKKSNNNGWRILRTYVPLPLNGWTRPWTRSTRESPIQGKSWTIK
jgi:hypothetical protein